MDAADIMFSLAQAYANCKSYCDRGIVRHFGDGESESYRHRVAFKTIFERPDKMYFEWMESPVKTNEEQEASHRVSAFWCDGKTTQRQFYSQSDPVISQSLEHAITASAGLSKGASVTVAAYMLPTLRNQMRTLLRLQDVRRLDDAVVDGVECYMLKGQTWNKATEDLYVDKSNNCLKRMRVEIVIPPGVNEAQYEALKKADPVSAEEYRKFREAQTEERRFVNQIDYHEVLLNKPVEKAWLVEARQKSDLVNSYNVL